MSKNKNQQPTTNEPKPKKKRKALWTILGAILGVIVLLVGIFVVPRAIQAAEEERKQAELKAEAVQLGQDLFDEGNFAEAIVRFKNAGDIDLERKAAAKQAEAMGNAGDIDGAIALLLNDRYANINDDGSYHASDSASVCEVRAQIGALYEKKGEKGNAVIACNASGNNEDAKARRNRLLHFDENGIFGGLEWDIVPQEYYGSIYLISKTSIAQKTLNNGNPLPPSYKPIALVEYAQAQISRFSDAEKKWVKSLGLPDEERAKLLSYAELSIEEKWWLAPAPGDDDQYSIRRVEESGNISEYTSDLNDSFANDFYAVRLMVQVAL
jgi:tetratricopeptide (TPR) repeat protein